ncbi:hypothetical protein IFM89_024247, partial [Coptis chinensis]
SPFCISEISEQRKQKIAEIKAGLKDAEALICKMDLEARSLQQNVKVMPLAKLREYKSDLNNLKIEVKRMTSANFNQAARNDFLEAGLAGKKMAVAAQRGDLVVPAAKLKQSSERIKESRQTMLDTVVRAVSVLQDLRRQRQSLLNTQEVVCIFLPLCCP